MWGRPPHPPLNNKTPALLQTAFCVHRLVYVPHFSWSEGKQEGHKGKRSSIRCVMCIFLHIGGLRPPPGRYAPVPRGPPDPQRGGGGAKRGGGLKLAYIPYYYTPLPLNIANKQQASKQQASKQALLLSVLAIAQPHRSGLYSTLAILEPRWCPCQIQVFSQKLTGGAPGRGLQVWRCPPKTAHFVPQNSLFLARNGLKTQSKRANAGKRFVHSTCASIAP